MFCAPNHEEMQHSYDSHKEQGIPLSNNSRQSIFVDGSDPLLGDQ